MSHMLHVMIHRIICARWSIQQSFSYVCLSRFYLFFIFIFFSRATVIGWCRFEAKWEVEGPGVKEFLSLLEACHLVILGSGCQLILHFLWQCSSLISPHICQWIWLPLLCIHFYGNHIFVYTKATICQCLHFMKLWTNLKPRVFPLTYFKFSILAFQYYIIITKTCHEFG